MEKEIIAVIPARGGSKGLPFKNLRTIRCQSLLSYAIRAARGCPYVVKTVVSTDCPNIAAEARRCGAEVVMRAAELSTDEASSEAVVLDVLQNTLDALPPLTALIQCTAPLIRSEDITRACDELVATAAQTCLTACLNHAFLWTADGHGVNHDAHQPRRRRQDLPPEYRENGCIYLMETRGFLTHKNRFFGRTCISEMPASRSHEVDSMEDLICCQALMPYNRLASGIRVLVTDFDGCLTDDLVTTDAQGIESITCARSDGLASAILRSRGIDVVVLTNEFNAAVGHRCTKIGAEAIRTSDKLGALMAYLSQHGIPATQTCYIGNDINDLACMAAVGLSMCPRDAHADVIVAADVVLSTSGGHGVLREAVDILTAPLPLRKADIL